MTADGPGSEALRAEILRQVEARGADGSICPSEVARAYGADWRTLLPRVRDAARVLARSGLIDILRKGRPIEPDAIRGVIRLRARPGASGDGVPCTAPPDPGEVAVPAARPQGFRIA